MRTSQTNDGWSASGLAQFELKSKLRENDMKKRTRWGLLALCLAAAGLRQDGMAVTGTGL